MQMSNPQVSSNKEVVGLIPAGGQATRLAPLPCSKELYPIGFRFAEADHSLRPKVVSHYLLEKMRKSILDPAHREQRIDYLHRCAENYPEQSGRGLLTQILY